MIVMLMVRWRSNDPLTQSMIKGQRPCRDDIHLGQACPPVPKLHERTLAVRVLDLRDGHSECTQLLVRDRLLCLGGILPTAYWSDLRGHTGRQTSQAEPGLHDIQAA